MATPQHDIIGVARGEEYSVTLELQNPDGTPLDFTGQTVTYVLRSKSQLKAHLVSDGSVTTGGTMQTVPNEGRVTVTLTPELTASVTSGSWALWFDELDDHADALVHGDFQTQRVVRSDG